MAEKKGNIILAPGPLHLFWTGGVYYLWELSKIYRVILVVGENYEQNYDFQKVIELAGITEVFYIPARGIIKKHLYYINEFKYIVSKYRPQYILHHDPVYISMMYLYYWGSKIVPPSLRISYLIGMSVSENFDKDIKSVVDHAVTSIANKYRLPNGFAGFLFRIKGWLLLWLDYYILPLLFIGKTFSPVMNSMTFVKLKDYWNNQFDFYLLYDSLNRKVMGKWFGSEDGIREIQHPLKTVGDELNRILYGLKEENIILILLSYGHLNRYQIEVKYSNEDIVEMISSKWIEVISAMKIKFPNYNFFWKLHPAQKHDLLWKAITNRIQHEYPDITLLLPEENAQKWILKSKVIVGEVSSVLWWSSFFATKITISFDIFGISFTDFFKYHRGVYYFSDLEDFCATDFTKENIDMLKMKESIPTLSDFLDEVCK